MHGTAVFSDPRKAGDRRTGVSKHARRKGERRSRSFDRRGYLQHGADNPWWLMRGYVTAEKFVANP